MRWDDVIKWISAAVGAIAGAVVGAWTGALVAALMEMRLKRAIPTIFVGVLIAGILVTLACTGVKALRFLV